MRLLALLVLVAPALSAMDADSLRFARRTLLNEQARKHLDARVGEVANINTCVVLAGDFDGDGKPDSAAVICRDRRLVLALFPAWPEAEAPISILMLTTDKEPSAAVSTLPGRDCVALSEKSNTEELHLTSTELWRWQEGTWRKALSYTALECRRAAAGRFERLTTTRIAGREGVAELITESRDTLDGTDLEGSRTRTTIALSVDSNGLYVRGKSSGEDTPVPTRVQLARTLEREGLLDLALEQAAAAVTKAERDKLASNDARLLDARALHQRLEARIATRNNALASR